VTLFSKYEFVWGKMDGFVSGKAVAMVGKSNGIAPKLKGKN
jgi:hypothetical protein